MKDRKQKEIEYYNKEAGEYSGKKINEAGARAQFNPLFLKSYNFIFNLVKEKGVGKKILDYGLEPSTNLIWLSEIAKEVIGIDHSRESLEVAQKIIGEKQLKEAKVLLMDCEKMDFPDNSFDIIFDGGTFSSLDLDKALLELARVLKPDGFLIGIETLGHNPFTNLNRFINKIIGRKNKWPTRHILKIKDLKKAEKYFNKTETHFFHLISWLAFPFLNLPRVGEIMLAFLEVIDAVLLTIFPFLKRYCFKIVFVFSKPAK